jgi:signal transduction histidine kinase
LAWAAAFLLFYAWQSGEDADGRFGGMVSLFGGSDASSTRRLRSEYERSIRQAAAQEERHRLARDLHDSIKQQLFAIHTGAATAQARFDVEPAGARAAIDQIRASAREAMGEMEAMLHGLRAAPLENVGLVEALKQSCEALAFRTGASVEFIPGNLPPSEALPPGAQDAVFRVAQEAFANIARHARAGRVRVTLGDSDGALELTVRDDGAGFDQAQSARGQGLANMRARAAEYGGHMEIISQPGNGTRARLTIRGAAPAAADAKAYGRRAFFFGMMVFYFLMASVFRPHDDMLILKVPLLILMVVAFVRELVAYRRTRKPSEARR